MEPSFLALQVAAGILLAAFIILLLRLGMAIYRYNEGWRGVFGALMFVVGLAGAWLVMLAGFGT